MANIPAAFALTNLGKSGSSQTLKMKIWYRPDIQVGNA